MSEVKEALRPNFWRLLFACCLGRHRYRLNTLWDGLQEVGVAHCEDCFQVRMWWPEGYPVAGRAALEKGR